MSYFDGIVLGIVQGLTEFIPVSSSGHLILAREFFGISDDGGLAFDAVLQLATILAVAVYFGKDLWGLAKTAWNMVMPARRAVVSVQERVMLGAVIFGTVPAVVVGLVLESKMETVFRSTHLVVVTLVLGAVLMWAAEKWYVKRSSAEAQVKQFTIRKGVMIGLFQCLALIPGISRSGSTISGGLFAGLERGVAARFSFLLAFPIILGSGLKKLLDLGEATGAVNWGIIGISSVVAFAVGLSAIHFLIRYLKQHTLMVFVGYRVVLAGVMVVLLGAGIL